MADPRITPPEQRNAHLSPLMAAKAKQSEGQKVNFCPFGCTVEDLDDHGYCEHLVGFTTDEQTLEPLITDEKGRKRTLGAKEFVRPVKPSDKLVRITTSFRVYREIGKKKEPAPA